MPLTNPYGDAEISDPRALRALAHPVRLALLERLQRHGPATATQLAPHVGATPSVVSWHLRHLASFGLITDWDGASNGRERWWQAAARGFRFTQPADAEGRDAARQLRAEIFARSTGTPQQWLLHDEPRLDAEWSGLAGSADTQVVITADELRQVEDAIETLLAPYVLRKGSPPPQDARTVRMLRFVLPEPADEAADDRAQP